MINKLWGRDDSVEICPMNDGMYVIQLPNSSAKDKILEYDSWHIQNKPLLIKKWIPGIKPLQVNLSKLPIWLHLREVPLELFNREGVSYIASVIERHFYIDNITSALRGLLMKNFVCK